MSRRSNNNATTTKVAAARPAGSQDRWTIVGVSIFLVAITWIVFGQTLHFEFINFDDGDYIYKNPPVARGLTLAGTSLELTARKNRLHGQEINEPPIK